MKVKRSCLRIPHEGRWASDKLQFVGLQSAGGSRGEDGKLKFAEHLMSDKLQFVVCASVSGTRKKIGKIVELSRPRRRITVVSRSRFLINDKMSQILNQRTDPELVRLMMAGDEEAFVTLYRRWQGMVFRFAWRMSGSESLAEDVTQEVFMMFLNNGARYEAERGSVATFLCGIARNLVLRRIERERPLVPLPEGSEEMEPSVQEYLTVASDPLGDLTRGEAVESVRQAVLSLPVRYREVVVLCDLEETSYSGAAAIVGCSVGTVRSRLHRGRALLIEKLRGNRPDAEKAPLSDPARCFA